MKMYQHLAQQIGRLRRLQSGRFGRDLDTEQIADVHDEITALVKKHFPSGSGFDAGTKLYLDDATPERYVFHTPFHHMNDYGSYDGWTEHDIVVTASMEVDFNLRVTGRDRNQIKDYIAETFQHVLSQEYVA